LLGQPGGDLTQSARSRSPTGDPDRQGQAAALAHDLEREIVILARHAVAHRLVQQLNGVELGKHLEAQMLDPGQRRQRLPAGQDDDCPWCPRHQR
jgi:hypothetical protein